MTTQESLLALAKAVYPDVDWLAHAYPQGITGTPNRGEHPYNHVYIRFDPANNSEQAMEVLCWLIRAANCNAFRFGSVDIRQTAIVIGISMTGDESRASYFDHDNTPASLRAAIVQAACRVVGG